MTRPFDVVAHSEADEVPCRGCGEPRSRSDLDRFLWCQECARRLERTARRGQHAVAGLIALPFLVWILAEGTEGVLPTYAWTLPLLAAYYLGSRIGRVLIRGYLRARRGG